ncbi:MAG: S8 family peptidase [Saprospiraceae bacterium]|nr:S8 family peptidase [Saprospiraceae bacterium]
MKIQQLIAFLLSSMLVIVGHAQDELPTNWAHLDANVDGYPGMSTQKTYKELLKGRTSQTIVVAVIDSGVDKDHEDLSPVMWVNEDEIPGNGIDDDNNGYIDDIHGWNFIGGKNGKNLAHENLEMTRLYTLYKKKYEGKSKTDLSKKEKEEFNQYEEFGKIIEKKKEELAPQVMLYGATLEAFSALAQAIGKAPDEITLSDVKNFKTKDEMLSRVGEAVVSFIEQGQDFGSIYAEVEEIYDYYYGQVNYYYNPEFSPRDIVGDDVSNPREQFYGNNDVKGPDSEHGTHVAGIIAAARGNDIGMDGVADNVRIMSIRTVPSGDERDKDVANAIRYAVDNGAAVINMSFGKGESPHKEVVDEAVKYALKNDVLLVHGSGNDAKEVTFANNFPNDRFDKKGMFAPRYAKNWLEVGASTFSEDENLVASFSNYSSDKVDVFAPGIEIYSTVPDNKYKNLQGTSMASPYVAGLAALLRSYFPTLTAAQVKSIIMESSSKQKFRVINPENGELVPFTDMCMTGGIVNTYDAVKQAMATKGKRKFVGFGKGKKKGKKGDKDRA